MSSDPDKLTATDPRSLSPHARNAIPGQRYQLPEIVELTVVSGPPLDPGTEAAVAAARSFLEKFSFTDLT